MKFEAVVLIADGTPDSAGDSVCMKEVNFTETVVPLSINFDLSLPHIGTVALRKDGDRLVGSFNIIDENAVMERGRFVGYTPAVGGSFVSRLCVGPDRFDIKGFHISEVTLSIKPNADPRIEPLWSVDSSLPQVVAPTSDSAEAVPDLYRLAFIPGCFECPKCGFTLNKTTLNVASGQVGTTEKDRESESCPNDGTPMKHVTYRDALETAHNRIIEQLDWKADHTKAVGDFLNEMYAIMVDPLADGEAKIEETCAALIASAKSQRQQLNDVAFGISGIQNTYQFRRQRQLHIGIWCTEAFGLELAKSLPQRGMRLLEESTETAQATGLSREEAHRVVDYVYGRPVGDLRQELGGVGVTLLALGEAADIDVDKAEQDEMVRVLSKPIEHFKRRNQEKNAAGLVARVLKRGTDNGD